MRNVCSILFSALLLASLVFTAGCGQVSANAEPTQPDPLGQLDRSWAEDSLWYDGKAEVVRYQATRQIYGQSPPYIATIYTNKEHLNTNTRTKSYTADGPRVFKFHVRDESIPTPKYRYDFSTMAYVGVDDMRAYKLEMGSQEDCGTTFKTYWFDGVSVDYYQSSYFPDQGVDSGSYEVETSIVFQDALPLILRGYPFDTPLDQPMVVNLLIDQTHTHLSQAKPEPYAISYEGLETLDLPAGAVEAHRLTVSPVNRKAPSPGGGVMTYWFAAEGDPTWLHVMVQYGGPFGTTYQMISHDRDAYWEH